MEVLQSFAVLSVGVGTLPIAAFLARLALKALFTVVLEGGYRPRPAVHEIPGAAVTVV
jgi:hypothetical protein